MEQYSIYIGIIAGVCTSVSMLPQLIKIIKDKKADDISYAMLIVLLTGLAGWLWYGIIKSDAPIIAANSFSILITVLVIFFSAKYKSKSDR